MSVQQALFSEDKALYTAAIDQLAPAVESFVVEIEWTDERISRLTELYTRQNYTGYCEIGVSPMTFH